MVRAKGQRRLVRDFLSSKEGNLQNITVDYNLYEKLARNPEHGFVTFKQDVLKEGLQGGQINLPVNRCNWTGRFICGWTSRFLSANELSDDIQLLFGGAEAMKVTWLVAIKEEAAREGLAREEHIVQLLNQHVEEVIVLDSGDEADDGRPMPPIGLWRPSSARRNAIILFFDEMADEEGRGGRASLDTGVASAGAASSDAGAATSSSGHGTHLAKKLKLSQQEELQKTVSEQEGLEVAMALSASLETVSEQESLEVSMAISASLEVDTLENPVRVHACCALTRTRTRASSSPR